MQDPPLDKPATTRAGHVAGEDLMSISIADSVTVKRFSEYRLKVRLSSVTSFFHSTTGTPSSCMCAMPFFPERTFHNVLSLREFPRFTRFLKERRQWRKGINAVG
jgi:hypothetical protein